MSLDLHAGCACTEGDVSDTCRGLKSTNLDAVDCRFLMVDDDSVNVASKNSHDCRLVLAHRGLAKVDNTTMHTYKSALS
jgi:hypothetical protein